MLNSDWVHRTLQQWSTQYGCSSTSRFWVRPWALICTLSSAHGVYELFPLYPWWVLICTHGYPWVQWDMSCFHCTHGYILYTWLPMVQWGVNCSRWGCELFNRKLNRNVYHAVWLWCVYLDSCGLHLWYIVVVCSRWDNYFGMLCVAHHMIR